VTGPISRNRLLGSLEEAASWPGADQGTVVTLATVLVAARADAEGSRYFRDLSERKPADATVQALTGFFQVRAGHDVTAAIAKLDQAATMDVGLPHYFRGLALVGLLPGGGPSAAGHAAADASKRADQAIADLEFVLAVRDHFPVALLRAAYQGLARAYLLLGRQQQADEALRRSGLGPAAADRAPVFTSFSVTTRDGMRLSAPRFIARLYHQRAGYWQPDGQGLDARSPEEKAAALDLLAGGKPGAFVTAAAALADQGDVALALEVLTPGLLRHPGSRELAELRQAVLIRLMEQRQFWDPFGFQVYAELAGAQLSPVG
jgi:hypothetical protein